MANRCHHSEEKRVKRPKTPQKRRKGIQAEKHPTRKENAKKAPQITQAKRAREAVRFFIFVVAFACLRRTMKTVYKLYYVCIMTTI